jgi:hypothetical protein
VVEAALPPFVFTPVTFPRFVSPRLAPLLGTILLALALSPPTFVAAIMVVVSLIAVPTVTVIASLCESRCGA